MLGMLPKDKGIASLIVAQGDELKKGPEVEQDDSIATESAAEKIFSAFESKDKAMLIDGIKDLMDILRAKEEMNEPEIEG